jgi:ribonuclease BN (tRNA processing enzyme)
VDAGSGDLTVTVLGCSGTYAGPDGACSGYLARSPRSTVVLDLGAGTLANLQRHVSPVDLDAVVLTHEHPDHWLDLPLLRNALLYMLGGADVPVYGTAGTYGLARTLIHELAPTLVWHTIDESSEVEIGDLRLRFSRTDHPVETLAVRVDHVRVDQQPGGDGGLAGRSLLYSADTGPAWDPGALGGGVDVLLCEASFEPAAEGRHQHLSARQAGGYATAVRAGRLVVTHVPPGVDPRDQQRLAATTYGGPIELAAPGDTFAV